MRNLIALSPMGRFLEQPFEILLASAALVTGSASAWGSSRPTSLAEQLTPWLLRAWGVALVVGGLLTLCSRLWIARAHMDAGVVAASRLEVVAMGLLATLLGVYAVAILAVGAAGLAAGPITLAWAAAFGVRARNISRKLAEWRRGRDGPDV